MAKTKTSKKSSSNAALITLMILSIAFGAVAIAMTVSYAVTAERSNAQYVAMENVYQRSFYELTENISVTENKLAKLLAASDGEYEKKLLTEIHENMTSAEVNLSFLPVSNNALSGTVKFINQLSGYTSTLAKNLSDKKALSFEDKETLGKVYDGIVSVKANLNEISKKLKNGYSISYAASTTSGDYNDFSGSISGNQGEDAEYPSMIYDGPFSDSQLNKEIKGLLFDEVTEEQARKNLLSSLHGYTDFTVVKKGESTGKFSTYDYTVTLKDGNVLFAQMTKKGGKLLTLSSSINLGPTNISPDDALNRAKGFAKALGLENMDAVWHQILGKNAYVNLAPIIGKTIIYPDLVKVKVDLSTGLITGFEAGTYYMNHTERNLPSPDYDAAEAKKKVNSGYEIVTTRLALIPVEYSNDELCYEFKCTFRDDTYYIYISAVTGKQINILRVIKTENGDLLM